jgi:hypothetical protein
MAAEEIQVEAEPIESLMSKIIGRYNRKPEGWKVLTDLKGNVLILGPQLSYRLKLISLNPHDYTGVGIEIGNEKGVRNIAEGVPSYGFRPLTGKETKLLFSSAYQKGAIQSRLVTKLLGVKPVPTWQLQNNKPKTILTGPVITHPNLSYISKSQGRLEEKLNMEAYRLFRKKYPGRAATYR